MPVRTISWIAAGLFVLSGFAALVYQVLWVRELGLLFGNTAQAAALAIAVFFTGLAAGGWFWGRWAPRVRSALAAFGLLEIGVAATALGHFLLTDAYHALYPILHAITGDTAWGDLTLRMALAALILFPPAFLMGGTLPMMGHFLVRLGGRLAVTGTAIYALNTLGSAAGALAAGFVLPLALGFQGAYLLAVAIDVIVGGCAMLLARRAPRPTAAPATSQPMHSAPQPSSTMTAALPHRLVWTIAFASGFATLGVEILWTRLFAQVLQNSVYTYAIVLVAFLLALAIGSLAANGLARVSANPRRILLGLLSAAAAVVALSPWAFYALTNGLDYVAAGAGWREYLATVSGMAVVAMVLPGILLGAVLPYLLRVLEAAQPEPGEVIGRLVAANTAGAVMGSLVAGFVLLPLLGVSASLLFLAGVYPALVAGVLLHEPMQRSRRLAYAAPALAAALALFLIRPEGLTLAQVNDAAGEQLIEAREGTHATAAVIKRDEHLLIRVNNYYTLGGTGALESERNQALIPMMTHPAPRSVFFLGMGTGITAGAALLFPVERVDVCEILPEVIDLAETHFGPWTQGLFDDDRVTITAEDGHHCLRHADTRYDLIISDLFTPWKAGTGNLYTREHYEVGRERLTEGGLFVQWLPLYQLSDRELGTIARTMDAVFPQVVAWRGDLFPDGSILALIGMEEGVSVNPDTLVRHGRKLAGNPDLPRDALEAVALRFYAGNITLSGLFDDYPVNTRNHPVIEYEAPRTQRRVQAGEAGWLIGAPLGYLYESLAEQVPPATDPYLAQVDEIGYGYIAAGRHYYHYGVLRQRGRDDLARRHLDAFVALTPFDAPPPEPEEPETRPRWEEGR